MTATRRGPSPSTDGSISETVDGRTNLLLGGRGARLAELSFRGRAAIGGRTRELDGVDRVRGEIRNCGGRGGDLPTELPLHDVTCTDASELVLVTPRFGATTATGPDGVEAIVRRGVVTELRTGGSAPVPAGRLRALRQRGRGRTSCVPPPSRAPGLASGCGYARVHGGCAGAGSIVNGGPALVREGRLLRPQRRGGLRPARRPGLLLLVRHPPQPAHPGRHPPGRHRCSW